WSQHRDGDERARAGRKAPETAGFLTLATVEFNEGDPETYVIPLALASERRTRELRQGHRYAIVATLRTPHGERALIDALWVERFCVSLLHAVARRRRAHGEGGDIVASRTSAFREVRGSGRDHHPTVMSAEQSNTSIQYG